MADQPVPVDSAALEPRSIGGSREPADDVGVYLEVAYPDRAAQGSENIRPSRATNARAIFLACPDEDDLPGRGGVLLRRGALDGAFDFVEAGLPALVVGLRGASNRRLQRFDSPWSAGILPRRNRQARRTIGSWKLSAVMICADQLGEFPRSRRRACSSRPASRRSARSRRAPARRGTVRWAAAPESGSRTARPSGARTRAGA